MEGKGIGYRFVCVECHKMFKHRYNLKIHARLHTGETPFHCTQEGCGMKFKWRSSLVNHRRHHESHINNAAVETRARLQRSAVCASTLTGRQEQLYSGEFQKQQVTRLTGPEEDAPAQLQLTVGTVNVSPDETLSSAATPTLDAADALSLSASSNLSNSQTGSNTIHEVLMQSDTDFGDCFAGDVLKYYSNLTRYPL
eukprot:Plantae.Rhodophyta-Purpureofilum_apyrenoidigerum.ctg1073.p1 GENE.Plantae.Rhodophyta-Purpureofilum_apyrenoidigerum.ctg1073~~Plantae.Rhodophyta-Purpureofilum_apyrenoidigerum.ctg1073.p1  ORF type:complete len:197 (+),score=13.57 Plantae.Rhodophyta-Purpureofilum_apyrenoidigerum.ctg1073:965-1555(+)